MGTRTTVSPWLTVSSDGDAIEFYKAAFGAVELYRVPGGGVAQLAIDGAEFWISDESERLKRLTPAKLDADSHWVLLIVDDPDAMWNRAVAAGASPDSEISEDHGWRSGRVKDPDGHGWEIGKPLAKWPPD
jgi:PhnB protein